MVQSTACFDSRFMCKCLVATPAFSLLMFACVIGRLIAPQNVHILPLGTYEYVTLHGKRDFADAIKIKTLRWKDCHGLSRCAKSNHVIP